MYLLYALYPCAGWSDRHHGCSSECDCEEFLEGVFSSADRAKAYIPEALDARHVNLIWEVEDNTQAYGYLHEYAKVPNCNLVYHIQETPVD